MDKFGFSFLLFVNLLAIIGFSLSYESFSRDELYKYDEFSYELTVKYNENSKSKEILYPIITLDKNDNILYHFVTHNEYYEKYNESHPFYERLNMKSEN